MGERLWIKHPLASFDGLRADTANGGVVIEGDRIVEVLAANATPRLPVDRVWDATGCLLLPGLINTHHHCYQTLTRAYRGALNKPLFDWLRALYPVWAHLNVDMVEVATELAACELMKSGCTTLVDHHYVFPTNLSAAIDHQVLAVRRLGIRAVLTRGSMSLSEKQGGLPPDSVVQDAAQILRHSEQVIGQYHDRAEGAMLQIALAPCSPFSVTPELMTQTAQLARDADVMLHTHLAETADETEFCLAQVGLRPTDYLASLGWLEGRAWFAHGIHFLPSEIEALAAARCGVAYCPTSNMTLASGICPVDALEGAGVPVGLAVDGSASNDCSNMIQEVRQGLLLQRLGTALDNSPTAACTSHLDALRWATSGGADLLQRPELGRLQVGAMADLALFRLDDLRFSGAQDPLAALVLCGAHQADAVMVNGQWRVQDGQLIDLDERQLSHRHQQLAHSLWAAL